MLPRIKQLRQEKGISQQALADAIGVSQPSINKYENHGIEPDIALLRQMADYFCTSVDYIIGRTDERRPIEPTEAWDLNMAEAELVDSYRRMDARQRACVDLVVQTLRRETEYK